MTAIYLIVTHVNTENEDTAYANAYLKKEEALDYTNEEFKYYKEQYPRLISNFELEDICWDELTVDNSIYLSLNDYRNKDILISISIHKINR